MNKPLILIATFLLSFLIGMTFTRRVEDNQPTIVGGLLVGIAGTCLVGGLIWPI